MPTPASQPIDPHAVRVIVSSLTIGMRTPLHALLGFGELLANSDLAADQRRLVAHMVDQAGGLVYACDRLTLLLRLVSGEPAPRPEPFDLGDVLAEATATASPTTPVSVRVHPQIPTRLVGDPEAVTGVLVELVSNAVTHARRPISVAVDLAGSMEDERVPLRITVADSGPGLPDQYLSQLNCAGAVLPEEAPQLGIFLANRLARRMGSSLAAVQRAGGATEVALQLSLGRADVPAVPSGEPDVAAAGEPVPLRILLVEDNGVNRILTSRQVTRLGHQLDDVATGGEGVRAVLDRHYDVVLMDRHLPDIDGIEATRQIRAAEAADPRRRRTPIVAITADALAGHREECLAAGMDGFLTKPVDLEHLSAAIIAFTPRPQPASTKSSDVDVDLSTLERLVSQFDGDTVPVSEMVRTYVDELPTRGERLRLALSAATAHDALAAAASLHAASVTIGAVGVARRCELIRAAAEANDLAGGRAVLPGLLELCERTAAILDTVEATSAG
ncbi:MAG: hypothetical protein V7603_4625 [Micromonosporaceae bacterium]